MSSNNTVDYNNSLYDSRDDECYCSANQDNTMSYSIPNVASIMSLDDLTNLSMPMRYYSSASYEDLSILSDSDCENDDWLNILLQDGFRMLNLQSREWILENVNFDQESGKKDQPLERTNISFDFKNLTQFIDTKECKHSSTVLNKSSCKFIKSAGNFHYYKPSQELIIKEGKVKKAFRELLSSENFGVTTMMICPPLMFAHWYAVYQKKSVELNCAKYLESEWVFNNREQCMESIAVLQSYPKAIEKNLKRYTQEELDSVFPRKIVNKRIPFTTIQKNGFSIEIGESKSRSGTAVYSIKCGSETLMEFISSLEFCENFIKLLTLISVTVISRTTNLSVDHLYELLDNEEIEEDIECEIKELPSSPDGEAVMYFN